MGVQGLLWMALVPVWGLFMLIYCAFLGIQMWAKPRWDRQSERRKNIAIYTAVAVFCAPFGAWSIAAHLAA